MNSEANSPDSTDATQVWLEEHRGAALALGLLIVVAAIVAGVFVVKAFLGYSSDIDAEIEADRTASANAPADPYADLRDDKGFVSREELSGEWPLTVDAGIVKCETRNADGVDLELVTFVDPKGTEYALNGSAKSQTDAEPIDAIWADAPDADGLKMDIGPLIDAGRDVC